MRWTPKWRLIRVMRLEFIVVILSVVLLGCDPVATKSVTLRLTTENAAQAVAVDRLQNSEVQAALEIVESVVKAHGFSASEFQPSMRQYGMVALYWGEHKADGSTPMCAVYYHPDKAAFTVLLQERGRFSSGSLAVSVDDDLRSKLTERFGKDRVKG